MQSGRIPNAVATMRPAAWLIVVAIRRSFLPEKFVPDAALSARNCRSEP